MNHLQFRDALLIQALEYTRTMNGVKQDRALFDYLCGAVKSAFLLDKIDTEVPAWLWVIGVRGGERVEEVRRMLKERDQQTEAIPFPYDGDQKENAATDPAVKEPKK